MNYNLEKGKYYKVVIPSLHSNIYYVKIREIKDNKAFLEYYIVTDNKRDKKCIYGNGITDFMDLNEEYGIMNIEFYDIMNFLPDNNFDKICYLRKQKTSMLLNYEN